LISGLTPATAHGIRAFHRGDLSDRIAATLNNQLKGLSGFLASALRSGLF
jgi:hypothetical protein